MAKKDVAKVAKGSKAAERKKQKKLSSWEKEYGDKLMPTQTRKAGSNRDVHYDVESGKWLEGSGPAMQVKKGRGGKRTAMKQGAKRKASEPKPKDWGPNGPPPRRGQ